MAEVCAEHGIRQLHVAETEKYAHVTYFFNGGREQEWEGEERHLVDSPRDVPTYDHKPEMSARAAPGTSPPTTQGGKGAPAPPPTPSSATGPRAITASASSTSPIPTWSATPA